MSPLAYIAIGAFGALFLGFIGLMMVLVLEHLVKSPKIKRPKLEPGYIYLDDDSIAKLHNRYIFRMRAALEAETYPAYSYETMQKLGYGDEFIVYFAGYSLEQVEKPNQKGLVLVYSEEELKRHFLRDSYPAEMISVPYNFLEKIDEPEITDHEELLYRLIC